MDGQCYNSYDTTPGEWSDIQISQHPESGMYRYEVKVNGVVVGSRLTKDPLEYEDVKMHSSDPWSSSSEGSVQELTAMPELKRKYIFFIFLINNLTALQILHHNLLFFQFEWKGSLRGRGVLIFR